jgi:flagellar hook-length control protein FliK
MNPLLTQLLANAQTAQGYKAQAMSALSAASRANSNTPKAPIQEQENNRQGFAKELSRIQDKGQREAVRAPEETNPSRTQDTASSRKDIADNTITSREEKILPAEERAIASVVPVIKERLADAGALSPELESLNGIEFLQALFAQMQQMPQGQALQTALGGALESMGTSLDAFVPVLATYLTKADDGATQDTLLPLASDTGIDTAATPFGYTDTANLVQNTFSSDEANSLPTTTAVITSSAQAVDANTLPNGMDILSEAVEEIVAALASTDTTTTAANDTLPPSTTPQTLIATNVAANTTQEAVAPVVSAFAKEIQKSIPTTTLEENTNRQELNALKAVNTESDIIDSGPLKTLSSLIGNDTQTLPIGHPKLTDATPAVGMGLGATTTEIKHTPSNTQTHHVVLDSLSAIPGTSTTQKTATDAAQEALLNGKANAERPGAGDQVLVQINRALKNGLNSISVKLDPAHLGRVDVRLDVHHDGTTSIAVIADRQETLDMLQRDSRMLERSLHEMGLSMERNSLSFDLRGGNQQQAQGDANGFTHVSGTEEEAQNSSQDTMLYHAALRVYGRGYIPTENGLDIRA